MIVLKLKIRSYNYNNIFQRFIFDQNFYPMTHFEKYAEKLVKNLDEISHLNYFIYFIIFFFLILLFIIYTPYIYTQYDNK